MKTVALIPVRGGSKSIPKKNIKPLGGKPLVHWTIQAALDTREIDAVFVSSDSDEILSCAAQIQDSRLALDKRPAEFATDTASTESVMLDFAQRYEFDRLVLMQATSPLTQAEDLSRALAKLDGLGADSLLTVTHEHRFLWADRGNGFVTPKNYDPVTRPRRQDWEGELVENGAFYICSRQGLLESGSRLHGKVTFHVMSGKTAVEIDTPDDWAILEALVQSQHQAEQSRSLPLAEALDLRLLVTDVDGVLTDGGMYYGPDGEMMKKFSTRDGMGLRFWRESGREIAIVTGETSAPVARRAEKLRIQEVRMGVDDKLPVVRELAAARGLSLAQVAYIGDDLNDLVAMQAVGFPACPADAHARVKAVARYACARPGGAGCVREFVEHLLAEPVQR